MLVERHEERVHHDAERDEEVDERVEDDERQELCGRERRTRDEMRAVRKENGLSFQIVR